MNKYIEKLLDDKLYISLSKKEGHYNYDLNTGMKSHCYVTEVSKDILHLEFRYDVEIDFNTKENSYIEFLSTIKKYGMCLSSSISYNWDYIFAKNGIDISDCLF